MESQVGRPVFANDLALVIDCYWKRKTRIGNIQDRDCALMQQEAMAAAVGTCKRSHYVPILVQPAAKGSASFGNIDGSERAIGFLDVGVGDTRKVLVAAY